MEKNDIFWFIEHISRELDVAAAVSVLLKQKYEKSIKILSINNFNNLKDYSPSIVILPYCYSLNDSVLKNCLKYWPEAVYFNLAWEQIFYKANIEYKAPRDKFVKKSVIHHAWSNSRAKLLQQKGIPEKNIFINGHPAYQLYKAPYR